MAGVDLDIFFKAAALLCNIAWAVAHALLALPFALLRCTAVDLNLWQPRPDGSCEFFEGSVQHTRSKPVKHQFTCVRSCLGPTPPFSGVP